MKTRGAYSDLALFRRLAREARPHRAQIGAIFVLSMLAAPLALLTPVPLAIAVDSAIGSQPLPGFLDAVVPSAISDSKDGVLVFTAVMFLVIAVLTQVQDVGTTVLKTYTGEKLLMRFRSKLFRQSQRLSLAYHDRVGTADSSYRVQEDSKALQYIAVESLISFIAAATTLGAMLYVTARIDLQLALVALAISPLLLITAASFRPRMRAQSRDVKRFESGALSVVQEVLTGLRIVKAFGQEDREHERFLGRSGQGMRARIRLAAIEGGYALLIGTLVGVGGSVVLFVGVHNVEQGKITLGELLLVMGYLTQLYAPIKMMARKAGSLQTYLASAERTFALLDEAPDVPEAPDPRPLARAKGAVEFRGVSFSYDPDRPVLKGVSFTAEPGARVGIAGVTGAGKTTLMSLLTRFYDPVAGRILLDGVDLRAYRLSDLRDQFGIVLQDPVLFSTTIAENIAYARPDASEREIEAAAEAANVHDFITGLPDGYATEVGERGMALSGGERQRISLARAFLKDAPILILDEPTSSVDLETEAAILDAMERLMRGRTSFMIAHRLSTLEACDLRLEMDAAQIVTKAPRAAAPRTSVVSTINGHATHPAAVAWRSLGGRKPRKVEVLRSSRTRRRGIYRLTGAGPGGVPVIAKLCERTTAEVECPVYEELLPRLPSPSPRFYGKVPDEERRLCWLFLDDVSGRRYSPGGSTHRRLAAEWLAMVQLHSLEILGAADLPDRGARHYLVHLLAGRELITRQLRRLQAEPDAAYVLEDLLWKLELLEEDWDELATFCDTLPQTLVHGDLVSKNLRVMGNGGDAWLAIFDWETAGYGVQAPDLAQLVGPERAALGSGKRSKHFYRFSANPALDTYRSLLAGSELELSGETVKRAAAVGNLFRCVAGINWTCQQATATWCPTEDFRIYSEWLGSAMSLAGWSVPSTEAFRTTA
jgi:ATP-binding cassette, subfamily B, bacterial